MSRRLFQKFCTAFVGIFHAKMTNWEELCIWKPSAMLLLRQCMDTRTRHSDSLKVMDQLQGNKTHIPRLLGQSSGVSCVYPLLDGGVVFASTLSVQPSNLYIYTKSHSFYYYRVPECFYPDALTVMPPLPAQTKGSGNGLCVSWCLLIFWIFVSIQL